MSNKKKRTINEEPQTLEARGVSRFRLKTKKGTRAEIYGPEEPHCWSPDCVKEARQSDNEIITRYYLGTEQIYPQIFGPVALSSDFVITAENFQQLVSDIENIKKFIRDLQK